MSWESLWRNACCYGMKLELCEYLLQIKLARSRLSTYNTWGIYPFCVEHWHCQKLKKNKTCDFESLPSNSTASNQGLP